MHSSAGLILGASIMASVLSSAAPAAENIRDVDTHHLFEPPLTREAWQRRAESLKQQILFSAGLYPMPERTALNPIVTGRIEGPDYSIENVAIETYPGFFLCGNLYRPKGKTGPFPGIANPHGHSEHGRFEIRPDVIAEPPPAKPAEGRENLPAIGVNLARQGHIVFAYDMAGYNDTNQIAAHREFAKGLKPWLWNVSLLGLQLWNSIRVVDFLQSLPDVDGSRIGCTGASGGGTQTFLLCAVDERVKVSVPVNMISAYMQGGCLCENGPGLRLGTDSVEIGALMAPRPMLLVAATGDWTKNNPTEEWPAIKKIYDLYDSGDRTAVKQFNYQHNNNLSSREAMYAWFGKWFLNDSNAEHFRERPYEVDVNALRVWNTKHPRPANALTEAQLMQMLIELPEKQLAPLWPADSASLSRFKELIVPALRLSLGVQESNPLHRQPGSGESIKDSSIVLIVSTGMDEAKMQQTLAQQGRRCSVLTLPPVAETSERLWDKFFTAYNRTATGDRVQAVVDAADQLRRQGYRRVDMIGLQEAGLWTLLARVLIENPGRTAIDVAKFNNRDDQAYIQKLYAPGLRRAGELRAAAVVAAPAPLMLYNTQQHFRGDEISAVYKALKASLRMETGSVPDDDLARWISAE